MKNQKIKWFLILGGFLLLFPLLGLAKSDSSENILVGEDEIINDNFVRAGSTVEIQGEVKGDVIVAGGTVTISGPVAGDVLAAGGVIKVRGDVEGNVRVVGGTVEISGKVGKNVNAFGGVVIIDEGAQVGWGLSLGAGSAEVRGKVGGNLNGEAGNIILNNSIGGDVNLRIGADGKLILYPNTIIGGNLTYTAPGRAEIDEKAEIKGLTDYSELKARVKTVSLWWGVPVLSVSYIFMKIASLFGLLIVGIVLISLMRDKLIRVTQTMIDKVGVSLGWGIFYLIVTPIILFILLITIIGAPLALIGFTLFGIILYLTKIFVGIVLGQKILEYLFKKKEASLMWTMILGTTVFVIITSLPIIGWLLGLLGLLWALGAIGLVKKELLRIQK